MFRPIAEGDAYLIGKLSENLFLIRKNDGGLYVGTREDNNTLYVIGRLIDVNERLYNKEQFKDFIIFPPSLELNTTVYDASPPVDPVEQERPSEPWSIGINSTSNETTVHTMTFQNESQISYMSTPEVREDYPRTIASRFNEIRTAIRGSVDAPSR